MRLNRIRSLLLLAMVVLSANSLSLTVIKKDFNELVDESDGVIHGTVSDIQKGIEQGDIYTWVTINNIDVIQGDFYEKTLTLRFCGGSYKSYNVSCGGVPQFDVGEEVVWFVKGNGSYSIPLSGGPQGVIYVGKTELKNSVGQSIKSMQKWNDVPANIELVPISKTASSVSTSDSDNDVFSQVVYSLKTIQL
jgi:hypothetical protein